MVAVAILAAGRGTRMKSLLPKVVHPLGGRTLVERALDSVAELQPERQLVIVGYGAEQVRTALAHRTEVEYVEQREQLGTGHAVQQVMPYLENFDGDLLILNGDVPLLRTETLKQLLATHQQHHNAATLLTAKLPNPKGYGRVFCDEKNYLREIVEDRDCTEAQRQNQRINAGVYCFRWSDLKAVLPKLSADNDQKEYYLTDAVNFLDSVMAVDVEDFQEISGINDRKQLAEAYSILQDRIKQDWMMRGVTLIDPASITIDDRVQIGTDTVIEPQTHLRGNTKIGTDCRVGPGTLIEDSQIGDRVKVLYSVVTNSTVAADTRVGPYANVHTQTAIGEKCRIGNFVELKLTTLGDRTNVAHLSYLGNLTAGNQVNIGAGTITANYDGVNKHPTVLGDRTKTGSNTVLVAPLVLGADVNVAAGSTVTDNVGDDALVIARARQVVKPGWRLKR
ncbi:MAG: bifunctional UDP-N-acetylglucosamine diphosphorylase/glucosamine-1-phosphate N-acetyltransferase GlmU [Thermosynechococcaceae cyanobacterium]